MVKAKAKKYSKNGPPRRPRGNGNDDPTEAVFRVDLETGKMRITDQRGDEIVEDPVTPEKVTKYGITEWVPLGQLFYAKCNIKHGGCTIRIINNKEVLIW